MAKTQSGKRYGRRHSMQEFGTVCGETQEVRVNFLKDRLHPLVPFPHRHDFYHMVVVIKGRGWHEIDFSRHPVRSHQIFFMKPGQVHSWRLDPMTSGYVVEFGSEAVPDLALGDFIFWNPVKLLDVYDLSCIPDRRRLSIYSILRQMHDEYEAQGRDFELSLRHLLVPLLIDLARLTIGTKPKYERSEDTLLNHFLKLVEEHFHQEHSVTFYSKCLKTSPKALTMKVSRAHGKSARSVIHERCMLEAKRLLAYSDLRISEVGYELGFDDPNHFARFFRSASGLAPSAFREKKRSIAD